MSIKDNSRKMLIARLNGLRGLFAIMIVIGHCSMRFERELLPLMIVHKFNMVFVCFFFFVSGMSLSYNLAHKENYLAGFIKNKIIVLMSFAFVAEMVERILESIILNRRFTFDSGLITEWNWYVYEMSVLYLFFYLVNKYIKQNRLREIMLWVAALVICLFTLFCYKYGNWSGWVVAYYYSTFSFPLGVTLYLHFESIQTRLMKHPVMSSFILLFVAACTCVSLMISKDTIRGGIFLRNIMGCCIMLCLFIILNKVDIAGLFIINKPIALLTRFSAEIYLYQFCLLDIWAVIYRQNGWYISLPYVVAVVVSTIVLGGVMHFVDMGILRIMKGSMGKPIHLK